MSKEGIPLKRKPAVEHAPRKERVHNPGFIPWNRLEDFIRLRAAGKADYWSPDYYELIDEHGYPVTDAKGQRVIVDLGIVTLAGKSGAMVKLPTLPESANERLGKKSRRESSLIKPFASFSDAMPGVKFAGMRRISTMRVEKTQPGTGRGLSEPTLERVDARDVFSVQKKAISFLLDRDVNPEKISASLAIAGYGPRLTRNEVREAIRAGHGRERFVTANSFGDLPISTTKSLLDAARKAEAHELDPDTRGSALLISQEVASNARLYRKSEQYVRDLLGNIDDKRWEDAKEAIAELRREVENLESFSFGTNTTHLEARGQLRQLTQLRELTLSPRDLEQGQRLKGILGRLNIQPWAETRGTGTALVIEYRRDIELLRAAMIFDYLVSVDDQKTAERLAREAEEKMEKVFEWISRRNQEEQQLAESREEVRREADALADEGNRKKAEDKERLMRMDLEKEEFREKRKADKERLIAEFFAAIPLPTESEFFRPPKIPADHYYRFGYSGNAFVGRASKERRREPEATHADEQILDADQELEAMQQAFDRGLVNEDTLGEQLGIVQDVLPGQRKLNLVLFPKKYEWVPGLDKKSRGYLRERLTGRTLREDDIIHEVVKARTGSRAQYDRSMRELILMNRTIILWKLRQVLERHPAADVDELFQAGIQGMVHAVEEYEMRPDIKFNSFLVPCLEGYIRRAATSAHYRSMRVSGYATEARKKYYEAEQTLQGMSPGAKVPPHDIMRSLHDQGVIKSESMHAFDRYVRKAMLAYKEVDIGVLEHEKITPADVDMLGRTLFHDMESADPAEAHERREKLDSVLSTLTPREERALRTYYEMYLDNERTAENVYEDLRAQLEREGMVLSSEQVKQKVRDLTEVGDLEKPDTLAKLSGQDRSIALRYRKLLEKHTSDETLESVGQKFGVTRTRVAQILDKALRKLKHPTRSKHVRPYVQR